MKHLARIATIDPAPVLTALYGLQTPFVDGEWRRKVPYSPHGDSDTLVIVGPPSHAPRDVLNSLDLVPTQFSDVAAFKHAVAEVAEIVNAKPARAMIVALHPGGYVLQHTDTGAYAQATERYHVALQTNPATIMVVESESAYFAPGELWWLDKHARHSACNLGRIMRVHLVVDVWREA